ncbi:MAG: NifB/NifX family molybdenum-iron cluster-binding protein [Anaerolineaceae bacterium]|nr:NifB/NifX family molybdenum-iron cluster-binding protein [Anaerolineaceae bacterium]
MRIALTSNSDSGIDAEIFDHFGHTPFFMIVDIDNQSVNETTIVANPFVELHQPGEVPTFLAEQKVDLVISGGMGGKAKDLFKSNGIAVVTGASGLISDVIDQYLKNQLENNPGYEPADKHTFHQ